MDEKVRELLEKAKLTAGLAADGAVKAAGAVSQKGTQLVEKTKRSFQVFDLNNEVELLMREIGRMIYLTHTGAETDEAALEEKLAQIDEKYAQIAELKAAQEAEKTTTVCPVCGKACDKNDLYCRICGEKLQ
ncbi:MAG: zinc ribbon domain-containing protein [Clostridia bacterium]|nr:zinc ribbon domain-containing protein [Clostridia bacterium]